MALGFVDLEKAIYTLPREMVMATLRWMGVPEAEMRMVQGLYDEAFRKMRYKQNMWRVYKHTETDKDYDAYKEALNAATNEVRKSKRNFEQKLAHNIKSDSKSFYAFVPK